MDGSLGGAAPADGPASPAAAGRATAERFNRWAADYDDSALQQTFYVPLQRAVLQAAARYADGAARVLDVGCGTGRLLRAAALTFPSAVLVGLDPAENMLLRARERGGGSLALVRADAHTLPFPDGSFDVVVSTASAHHWTEPTAAVAEIARVLRPDGVFVMGHLVDAGRRSGSWAGSSAGPWSGSRSGSGSASPSGPIGRRIRDQVTRRRAGEAEALVRHAGLVVAESSVRMDSPVMPPAAVVVTRHRRRRWPW